jgi:hypothetical protein
MMCGPDTIASKPVYDKACPLETKLLLNRLPRIAIVFVERSRRLEM